VRSRLKVAADAAEIGTTGASQRLLVLHANKASF